MVLVARQFFSHGSSAMRDVVSMLWDAHSPIAALITLKRDSQCTALDTYGQSKLLCLALSVPVCIFHFL